MPHPQYGHERQGNRVEVLELCKGIAEDLLNRLDKADALEFANQCRHRAQRYWQRANWRMIEHMIERGACPECNALRVKGKCYTTGCSLSEPEFSNYQE